MPDEPRGTPEPRGGDRPPVPTAPSSASSSAPPPPPAGKTRAKPPASTAPPAQGAPQRPATRAAAKTGEPPTVSGNAPARNPSGRAPAAETAAAKPGAGRRSELDDLFEAVAAEEVATLAAPAAAPTRILEVLARTPSWLVSMLVHMFLMIVLALYVVKTADMSDVPSILSSVAPQRELEKFDDVKDEAPTPVEMAKDMAQTTEAVAAAGPVDMGEMSLSPSNDLSAAPMRVEVTDLGIEQVPPNELGAATGSLTGTALAGRSRAARKRLVRQGGGSDESEKAVALALDWLAKHQMPDGGWSLNLNDVPSCRGKCRYSGRLNNARIAATALALLPFLGAGQTHKEGEYQNNVRLGIYFLIANQRPDGGLNESGGMMYSHGLASIALCEAYALTNDRALRGPAQSAIDFIVAAQDPNGGGWRYEPRQPGDTSILGWQLMSLKSAQMAYLVVPPQTIRGASFFLDSVQSNNGAAYGYTSSGEGDATTAIGLLCRMYMGWKKETPALQQGVAWLSERGPSSDNFYYNYYATQVMHHWGGPAWDKWNSAMRDQVIHSQGAEGHERGSWFISDSRHNVTGGRLYCTSLATMILEVYYRHLPIYRSDSVDEEFPL